MGVPVTSTVPLVKQTIRARLVEQVGAVPVLPAEDLQQVGAAASYIFTADVDDGEHVIPTMRAGRKPREETYRVRVVFVAHDALADTAEVMVFALLARLEDVVADDPGLGLDGEFPTLRAMMDGFEQSTAPHADGWRAELEVWVRVAVRLG